MDLFVVRVVVAADRMLVIGMRVPGEAPAPIDMAVVMAPPNHHQTDEGDLADGVADRRSQLTASAVHERARIINPGR